MALVQIVFLALNKNLNISTAAPCFGKIFKNTIHWREIYFTINLSYNMCSTVQWFVYNNRQDRASPWWGVWWRGRAGCWQINPDRGVTGGQEASWWHNKLKSLSDRDHTWTVLIRAITWHRWGGGGGAGHHWYLYQSTLRLDLLDIYYECGVQSHFSCILTDILFSRRIRYLRAVFWNETSLRHCS